METRLQNALVENKVLKEKCKYVESRSETVSYALSCAGWKQEEACAASPVGGTKEKYFSAKGEV